MHYIYKYSKWNYKNLINSFYFTSIVKLYTSNTKQETFNYSKVKGPIFLFQDKMKNYIKVEPYFYCFSFKFGWLGFQFSSSEDVNGLKQF